MLRLSVLDQSTVVSGRSPHVSIRESIRLAQHCEALGYDRYWCAEHHNSPSQAGTAPEILIAAIAATLPTLSWLAAVFIGGLGFLVIYDALAARGGLRGVRVILPEVVRLQKDRPGTIELRIQNDAQRARLADLDAVMARLDHRVLFERVRTDGSGTTELVGGYWGSQDTEGRYAMVVSVFASAYRGRGLYTALLPRVVEALV